MTIEAHKGIRRGAQGAKVSCDNECGAYLDVSVRTLQRPGAAWNGEGPAPLDEGQLMRKITQAGWVLRAKKHICPACQDRAKAETKERIEMANIEAQEAAKMDRMMKRSIRSLLDEVYDVDAGRYRSNESDLSVASTIGGGCKPEWVAQERCDGYGEGGGNEALAGAGPALSELQAEIAEALEEGAEAMSEVKKEIEAAMKRFSSHIASLNALREKAMRIEAEVKALNKRFGT